MEFEWDDANESHLGEHDIEPFEAMEVLLNKPVVLRKGLEEGEFRVRVIGETDSGRRLVVVFAARGDNVRVVTGFKPNLAELRTYRGRKGR